ncbi:metal-dependent hydrolase family protein [Microbacterium immunditiarum]|uniref:Imidazolonepropionase-like amidohydrolase n=1 Tax=Microbacterium immunditiarum TaxID=337480 RepID=A0A7Y9KJ89_9MICO|nr:amidohydrolase family protein [Microbacterium immunditiarum]NYE19401.1 imidazolonepropionase-like amidohydrolase [Microbacterium immunditiarum]
MREVLRGARVLDGLGGDAEAGDILLEDGLIVDLGSGFDADVETDVSGRWIMPGAIDCHVHAMVESFDLDTVLATPFSLAFYVAARNLALTLQAGVTFVRDAGGADLGVKRAQELGYLAGPAMQISVNLLSITGGHADHWSPCGYALPDLLAHPGRPDGVCDGPAEVVRRTREMIRAGADFVKLCATGGVLSPRDHPSESQFLPEELRLIVETAAAAHRPVAAHAQGAEGVKNAVRAGVRSIEHGTMIDDEAIDEMLARGTFLVPTLAALRWVTESPEGRRPSEVEQAREILDVQRESVTRTIEAGVRIAVGSDAGVVPHGTNLRELELLVEFGMSPRDAIRAATSEGADLLGIGDRVGRIAPGYRADLLVLDSDPLESMAGLASGSSIVDVRQAGKSVRAGV